MIVVVVVGIIVDTVGFTHLTTAPSSKVITLCVVEVVVVVVSTETVVVLIVVLKNIAGGGIWTSKTATPMAYLVRAVFNADFNGLADS